MRPFVQSNPEASYYVRGQKIRIKDELRVNQYFNLNADEKTASPFDFWDRSVLTVLGSLSPAEIAGLRSVALKTEKIKMLDRVTLEEAFKQAGMSAEALGLRDDADVSADGDAA